MTSEMSYRRQKQAVEHGEPSELRTVASGKTNPRNVWTRTKKTIYQFALDQALAEVRGRGLSRLKSGIDTVLQLPFPDTENAVTHCPSVDIFPSSRDTSTSPSSLPIPKSPSPISGTTKNESEQQEVAKSQPECELSVTTEKEDEDEEERRKNEKFNQLMAVIEEAKIRESRFSLPPLFPPSPPEWLLAPAPPVRPERQPTPTPPSPVLTMTQEELNFRWKSMRSPPRGHVHNWLCPPRKEGDSKEVMGPLCTPSSLTLTLFDINPFTKFGRELKDVLDRRDRHAKAQRDRRNRWKGPHVC